MAEETTIDTGDAGAGSSPVEFLQFDDGTKSTTEYAIKAEEPSAETIKTEAADDGEKESAKEPEKEKEPEADRFDKHPRFQQLRTERNAERQANQELRERLARLEGQLSVGKPEKEVVTLDGKSAEEIQEMMETDPAAFYKAVSESAERKALAAVEQRTKAEAGKSQERAVMSTYEKYGQDNPDFVEKWDDGSLRGYMDKHPGHTAISAHMAMTMEDRIKTAEERGRKAGEEQALKNHKAKQGASTIGADLSKSASSRPAGTPPELKNPNKYGGATAVIAQRLAARRAAAG